MFTVNTAGMTNGSGLLLVSHNGEIGAVCDDHWDDTDASVVCQQLGYSDGKALTRMDTSPYKYWLDDVECTGDEKSLSDCPNHGWGVHNCETDEGAGVICCDRG